MKRAILFVLAVACVFSGRGAIAGLDPEGNPEAKSIVSPGVPGSLVVFGPGEVIWAARDGSALVAVAAKSSVGMGSLVVFSHGGYLSAESWNDAGTWALIESVLPRHRRDGGEGAVRVLVPDGRMREAVGAKGCEGTVSPKGEFVAALTNVDVLVLREANPSGAECAAMERFLNEGGTLLAGQTAWGWLQIHSGKELGDNALHRFTSGHGISFTTETIDVPKSKRLDRAETLRLIDVEEALRALEGAEPKSAFSKDDSRQIQATLTLAARSIPREDTLVMPRLRALRERAGGVMVSKKTPVRESDVLQRVALVVDEAMRIGVASEEIKADPSAGEFPGAVAVEAVRVTREVEIDARVPGWHSTGLYAPAGEVIRIGVPQDAPAMSVQIGCHTDSIAKKDRWDRVPRITTRMKLLPGENRVASAFGGLVYLIPNRDSRGADSAAEHVRVSVSGAVEAPRFVLGETDVDAWRSTIRKAPGPWAELETGTVIVSVPSSHIRDLEDPRGVLEVWNKVLDAAADLATIPRERDRPQRYVADVQISAGYMHSGYPIMTHLDAADEMVEEAKLRAGSWGLFHELGHNHQQGTWTFHGTGEVTCNLFSLYIMETVCGKNEGTGHEALAKRLARRARYLAEGASFEKWCSDPFLALTMYIELREAFGWEAYKAVFAEYRDLPKGERPTTEQEKRDQWMVRFSRKVGRNLGPFFSAWGVPVSDEAVASVASLPEWMPADWPDVSETSK
ncbi:MAG: M60 family metallopeptidase [Phycisphaerales bacterium]